MSDLDPAKPNEPLSQSRGRPEQGAGGQSVVVSLEQWQARAGGKLAQETSNLAPETSNLAQQTVDAEESPILRVESVLKELASSRVSARTMTTST